VTDNGSRVSVRPIQEGDLAALLAVYDGREPQGKRRTPSALERETWATMRARPGLTVYVAEVDNFLVGTATLLVMANLTYACAPSALIEAVVVLPSYRRRGVARALLLCALQDAKAAGCNKVQLLSHKRHAEDGAHRLYASLGFEAEAEGFRRYLREVPPAAQPFRAAEPLWP
jgi:GNAT superfamily N-acetyltransferase